MTSQVRYRFLLEHAQRYGDREAIFLYNLIYWLKRNRKRGHNLVQSKVIKANRFWSYNTNKALCEIFSFWTPDKLRTIIKSLVSQGVMLAEILSKDKRDRTLWFGLSDERMIDEVVFEDEDEWPSAEELPAAESQSPMHLGNIPSHPVKATIAGVKTPNSYSGAHGKRLYPSSPDANHANDSGATLNVIPEPVKRFSLSRLHAEAVNEAVLLTADERSRPRWAQLYRLIDDNGLHDEWKALIASIRAKQRSQWKPIGPWGGYFNGAVGNILEAAGVYVPVGSRDERSEARRAILEGMGEAK